MTTRSSADTPESVTRAIVDTIARGDAAAATNLCADDATVFFPVDNSPLRADGKAAIREVFARLLKPGSGAPPPPEDLRVQRSGKAAIVTFQMRNPHVTSRRTVALEQRGGRWVIVHLHGSNVRVIPSRNQPVNEPEPEPVPGFSVARARDSGTGSFTGFRPTARNPPMTHIRRRTRSRTSARSSRRSRRAARRRRC